MLSLRQVISVLAVCLGFSALAHATNVNITIFDKQEAPGFIGIGQGREDNETEPGTVTSQIWDLEGMFLDGGRYLSLVGGYNFRDGVTIGSHNYASGDILIDIDNNAIWGSSSAAGKTSNSDLHWDYAIRLNFVDSTYVVWELTNSTTFLLPTDIATSNPWRVNGGQGDIASSGSLFFQAGLTDAQAGGFSDWGMSGSTNHYAVTGIDLNFINGETFLAHFVMECGNDPIAGSAAVPEPATIALLGIGVAGLFLSPRRQRF